MVGVFKDKESTEEKEFVEAAGHLDDQVKEDNVPRGEQGGEGVSHGNSSP